MTHFSEEDLLMNLYKSITFTGDLNPDKYFQISGSMRLEGNIKVTVYSNDHGNHLHVQYPPDGIDARFSWPGMVIEKYKSTGKEFSPRQKKNIQVMCRNPLVREFLQQEFNKRAGK